MIFSINFSSKYKKSAVLLLTFYLFVLSCAPVREPLKFALVVSPPSLEKLQIAAFPVENLSGTRAPARKIGESLRAQLKKEGLNILDDNALEEFMSGHRLRYTGALDIETARAFRDEIGIDAVLITSLELYDESYPPKISLISRLVFTGDTPQILWMDSAGLSGDESPGLLGLGLIEDPEILLKNALENLSRSLADYISVGKQPIAVSKQGKDHKFYPKFFYRSPILSPDLKYRIAVMPFLNKSERKNAGDIMMLHFLETLRQFENFDVIEPGIVRQNLLSFRIIMNEGISFANAGLIFSTLEADADLILSGTVVDYQDYHGSEGTAKVDFSVLVIEKKSHEIVWTSKSYNTGDEGVFFFDFGKVYTAHIMASEMISAIGALLAE
ncbi:MAG: hypothetical protein C4538_02890 [Nitrospiraceae bacterium]|nr:MAG: hypothetical protein C4538_02890 [Nitrospiraceae bacterium]